VLRSVPALELVPGEDITLSCFFLTTGSNMPRASAKLAPVNPNAWYGVYLEYFIVNWLIK
jgi:hypothetical protein